jgi:hypothetical protein
VTGDTLDSAMRNGTHLGDPWCLPKPEADMFTRERPCSQAFLTSIGVQDRIRASDPREQRRKFCELVDGFEKVCQ